MPRSTWFAVRRELSPRQTTILTLGSFLLPLLLWSAVSYIPWLWHPLVLVTEKGDSPYSVGMRVPKEAVAKENQTLLAAGKQPIQGDAANPVFLPAPHEVAAAAWRAFTAEPRKGDKSLGQALLHSISIIAWGFGIAAVIGVPLGIFCGVWAASSRLVEPVVDFLRYMPPPTFGALSLAILGIADEPKIAIIVIGILFNLILVVANTTRQVDRSLLEAAQTLGAGHRRLVTGVVIPAALPTLYNDLRIFLGVGWTYLTVAEMVGATSGISQFINQQGKYRNYDNVFAGIAVIGMVGLVTDQILAALGKVLFPWTNNGPTGFVAKAFRALFRLPIQAIRLLRGTSTTSPRGMTP
jgi:NitT/TauT family transport system permease protein